MLMLFKRIIRKVSGGRLFSYNSKFPGSKEYWEERYTQGGNSGSGSYNRLANFKASILNDFVASNGINSVIEFGCGDGNQLSLAKYPKYTAFDVSNTIIKNTASKFRNDHTKSFFLYDPECFVDPQHIFKADLSLSLDVIYHIIEQNIFELYLRQLFASSQGYVIIYSSNYDSLQEFHVKHRCITKWISENISDWEFMHKIDNEFQFDPLNQDETSLADFYLYKKKQ